MSKYYILVHYKNEEGKVDALWDTSFKIHRLREDSGPLPRIFFSDFCCGPGWILDYNVCEKMWIYECIHDKAYFNVLFVSAYILNGYYI